MTIKRNQGRGLLEAGAVQIHKDVGFRPAGLEEVGERLPAHAIGAVQRPEDGDSPVKR